jgi:hypothetical protein
MSDTSRPILVLTALRDTHACANNIPEDNVSRFQYHWQRPLQMAIECQFGMRAAYLAFSAGGELKLKGIWASWEAGSWLGSLIEIL